MGSQADLLPTLPAQEEEEEEVTGSQGGMKEWVHWGLSGSASAPGGEGVGPVRMQEQQGPGDQV